MSGGFGADKFVDVLLVEVQTGGIFHTELVVSLLDKRAFFQRKLAADVNPALQEKLCDQVAIIKNGKLIRAGSMAEVRGDASLETVFLELEGGTDER